MTKKKQQNNYDFGWGETVCVRNALKHYYKRRVYPIEVTTMSYPPDYGNDKLIEYTRKFLKDSTGINYKYICITNGTTGALNVVLRALRKEEGFENCYTHQYHFPYYPGIIEKNGYVQKKGLYQQHEKNLKEDKTLAIVDSPTNPEGNLLIYGNSNNNIIWDSVYHNSVFINHIPVKPEHRVNCGSYSKVLGLTGVRIGWIATNDAKDFELFAEENLLETCTVSCISQELVVDVLENTDLEQFFRSARYRINNNREMFQRLEYLFDGQEIPENGMFYVAWATKYVRDLFLQLGIKYVTLDSRGNDKLLRFNLAQCNDLTKKAVRYILSEDNR